MGLRLWNQTGSCAPPQNNAVDRRQKELSSLGHLNPPRGGQGSGSTSSVPEVDERQVSKGKQRLCHQKTEE